MVGEPALLATLSDAVQNSATADQIRGLILSYLRMTRADEVPMHWHPLGFIDVPLSAGDILEQRKSHRPTIHVWHPDFTRPQMPAQVCHSHDWDLESTVVAGTLENIEFVVQESPQGEYRKFAVSYENLQSVSTRMPGSYNVSEVRRLMLMCDTRYEVPGGTFHWSRPEAHRIVITTMTRSPMGSSKQAETLRRYPCEMQYRYLRAACEGTDKQKIIQSIIDTISSIQ